MYAGPIETKADLTAALDLARREFDVPFDDKATLLGRGQPVSKDCAIVLKRSGAVLAALFLVERALFFADGTLPAAFFTAVVVAPQYRGMGLSRLLMDAAEAHAMERDNALAIVVARRSVDHYYGRFGFNGIAQYARLKLNWPADANATKLESSELAIMPSIHEAYEASYGKCLGSCRRAPPEWRFVDWKIQKHGYTSLCLPEGDGYAVLNGDEILEVAATDRISMRRLLSSLSRSIGPELSIVACSPQHAVFSVLQNEDYTLSLRSCRYGGHMVKRLNAAPEENTHEAICNWLGVAERPDARGLSFNLTPIDEA